MVDYYEDDEVFRNIDTFYKRWMERMFREMRDFEQAIRSGQLKGDWDITPIKKPGVRGYIARGQFQLGLEPRALPARIPKQIIEREREPLTDIFNEKENVKIYIELPGVDRSDIQLNVTERNAEVRAKNFFKALHLPTADVDLEKITASYKNGVLEVTIPKTKKTVEDAKKHTIKIE